MSKEFSWDDWAAKSTFSDVWNNTAYLQNVRSIPTSYSPDGKNLYLSSVDYAIDLDSVSQLEDALDHVLQSYISRSLLNDSAHTRLNLAIRRCDFEVICLQLHSLKEMNVDQVFSKDYNYSFPDDLFENLLKEQE